MLDVNRSGGGYLFVVFGVWNLRRDTLFSSNAKNLGKTCDDYKYGKHRNINVINCCTTVLYCCTLLS